MSDDAPIVARLDGVTLRYPGVVALDAVRLDVPADRMVGLIGPDGVGKSSLLALIAGSRKIQGGRVEVLGGDMRDPEHRRVTCPRIAYMPQGLGKNLYPTLSVLENVDFFGRLFGQSQAERAWRIADLLESTGLSPFIDRPAGKLSGGMKQKLSLCCALIHDPDLLILDEPTTGVDPLSRNQFWELIGRIRERRAGMSVLVATAYMEEAERFDWLVAVNAGQVLATGAPAELHARTGETTLEAAFIALLPQEVRRDHHEVVIPPRPRPLGEPEIAIEAHDLTRRFGDFTAVDRVSFRIERGEIFGFLGSNGCGKSTTMKMLTGLLPASEGTCALFGRPVDASNLETRRHIGYMSQAFSLYGELTVRQNLVLHARLFHLPPAEIAPRVAQMLERFGLEDEADALPASLPLGIRQRLSLAVAVIHDPEILILDEPTSGVDPIARDGFWELIIDLSRKDGVTIFITTHFMNEAERCDRISLMHAGDVLACDRPSELVRQRGLDSLEATFIAYLEDAAAAIESSRDRPASTPRPPASPEPEPSRAPARFRRFSPQRLLSYARREAIELSRDPIRLTLAAVGTALLMFIMGYGISLDVEHLPFAVLDADQTTSSQQYAQNVAGSPRYFVERPPLGSYDELDRRMISGELSLALELQSGFGRDLKRRDRPEVGVWIDGSMPNRAETIRGYVLGMHRKYLETLARESPGEGIPSPAVVELRYRYNPDVRSLPAMVPAVIPLLLIMIPSMLTALGVVREKELGSIINFYVTPVTRLEFLVGKQLPYVAIAMGNLLLMVLMSVTLFEVPLKGSSFALLLGGLLYVICATGIGLLVSVFMRSQIAAMFCVSIATMLPATQFSGLIQPVTALESTGRFIGTIFPTSHFLIISRGTFAKALGFGDLAMSMVPLLITIPVLLGLSVVFLKKQED